MSVFKARVDVHKCLILSTASLVHNLKVQTASDNIFTYLEANKPEKRGGKMFLMRLKFETRR